MEESPESGQAGAPNGEIEITPEMLCAGVAALDGWFPYGLPDVQAEDLVRDVLGGIFCVLPSKDQRSD